MQLYPTKGRGSQVVRPRSAKPLFVGSIPTRASSKSNKIPGFTDKLKVSWRTGGRGWQTLSDFLGRPGVVPLQLGPRKVGWRGRLLDNALARRGSRRISGLALRRLPRRRRVGSAHSKRAYEKALEDFLASIPLKPDRRLAEPSFSNTGAFWNRPVWRRLRSICGCRRSASWPRKRQDS